MKKFFAVLKSVLTWFLLLTYPIVLILLILLIPIFRMAILMMYSPRFPM